MADLFVPPHGIATDFVTVPVLGGADDAAVTMSGKDECLVRPDAVVAQSVQRTVRFAQPVRQVGDREFIICGFEFVREHAFPSYFTSGHEDLKCQITAFAGTEFKNGAGESRLKL